MDNVHKYTVFFLTAPLTHSTKFTTGVETSEKVLKQLRGEQTLMGEQKRGGGENKQQDIFLTTWSTLIKSFHIYFIFIYISSYINLSAI